MKINITLQIDKPLQRFLGAATLLHTSNITIHQL